jgi:hypothetical protein
MRCILVNRSNRGALSRMLPDLVILHRN